MAVVERAFLPAYGNRFLKQGNRPLAQALAPIRKADAFEKLSAHFRLQAEIPPDFFRAAIEKVLGSRRASLRIERVGLREYVHQERRHLLRAVALLSRRVSRQLNAV